jgi:hypothetical protein
MSWVHQSIYAAGGDHIPDTWSAFQRQTNIQSVLHLQPGAPAEFRGPPAGGFLWLDLAGEAGADLETRWLAAEFLSSALKRGDLAMIHSSLNLHRTRWALVAYLIYAGMSIPATMRAVEKRPWLAPYHTERRTWEDFERLVESRRDETEQR